MQIIKQNETITIDEQKTLSVADSIIKNFNLMRLVKDSFTTEKELKEFNDSLIEHFECSIILLADLLNIKTDTQFTVEEIKEKIKELK